METVIVLRQTLETATDAPPVADTEPTLPAPEALGAQFNHRYSPRMIPKDIHQDIFLYQFCTPLSKFSHQSHGGRTSQGNVPFKVTELSSDIHNKMVSTSVKCTRTKPITDDILKWATCIPFVESEMKQLNVIINICALLSVGRCSFCQKLWTSS